MAVKTIKSVEELFESIFWHMYNDFMSLIRQIERSSFFERSQLKINFLLSKSSIYCLSH